MSGTFSIPAYSISNEKTDISVQKSLTNRMIKEFKTLKYKKVSKNSEKLKLKSFHYNSLKLSLTNNSRYNGILDKYMRQSLNTERLKIIPPLSLYNSYRRNNNNTFNNTLSLNSFNSTLHNSSFNKKRLFITTSRTSKTRNKSDMLRTYNTNIIKSARIENIQDFLKNTKKMFYENYIMKVQKKEYNLVKEEKEIAIDLMNLEIFNYQRMLKYIRLYINNTDEYINFLNKTIEHEKEINENLWERRNEVLHETYLLRYRFARVQRVFEISLDNKFFLLCVKNGTNIIEDFTEEDQRDYANDCNSLYLISNFNKIQKKMAKKKTISVKGKVKRYSLLEEKVSTGDKIFKEPHPIFERPEDFKKKLTIISTRIQHSLILYNEKEKEVTNLRNDLRKKIEEIEKEDELTKFFNDESTIVQKKLAEVKYRNEYLKNFLKNIPQATEENPLLDKKIREVHKSISEKEEFVKRPRKSYRDKVTNLTRMHDIEDKINFLIYFKNYQKEYNYSNYIIVQKEIEARNKEKACQLAILKKEKEIKEKQRKVEEKNNRIIIKPIKKVPEIFKLKNNPKIK